jgi:modulator of FtsH protease
MESSTIADWSGFFAAAAGAAGALAGLVFVSLSINLARIIELPAVSGRAAETLILLAGTLAGTLLALMPHQSSSHLGLSLLVVALPTWLGPVIIQARSFRAHAFQHFSLAALRAVLHQVATLPGVLAGLSLCGLFPGGIAWFAFGVIACMLLAMFNAWILLVEILR